MLPNFDFLGRFGKGINRFLDIYILRPIFETKAKNDLERQFKDYSGWSLNKTIRKKKYIVSITSFPERIDESWISIFCLMNQTFKPDKIILWLAESQFPGKKIPAKLYKLKKMGLEIRFCEDLRSHKKYYYSFKEYPNDYILTFDDDLYYDNKVIENLVRLKKQYPNFVVANRCHLIRYKYNSLLPYKKWSHNTVLKEPSYSLFHTSGAGVLFDPSQFSSDVYDKDIFLKLSYNSDDVWLKAMSIVSNLKTVTNDTYNKDFVTVGRTQQNSLVSHNTGKGGKDIQLNLVFGNYGIKILDNKITFNINNDN
jgi:hypothetical protein